MHELAPGVFVETGFRRINVGAILTDDGFVLIDTPPFPDDARAWRAALAEVCDCPIVAIVTTDCHRDRVVGTCWFEPRALIAHEETITALKNLPTAFLDAAIDGLAETAAERASFSGARLRLPSVGFSQRMQVRYGKRPIHLLSMAGPTPGSTWVHLPEQRIVFTGDSITVNQHPHISNPATKSWLDNLTELRRARFAAEYVVPGRGPITDKSATEPISHYLRLARRRVASLYNAGRPRADTSGLVPELVDFFPFDHAELEDVQRRVKAGLDRIYEEYRATERSDSGSK